MENQPALVPQSFHLVLLIHAHQPCGNFGHVLEKSYQHCYLPFIELLEKHPSVRLGLHHSGPLLTWVEDHHPEYFKRLKTLVQTGQEQLGAACFTEPITISVTPTDAPSPTTPHTPYASTLF